MFRVQQRFAGVHTGGWLALFLWLAAITGEDALGQDEVRNFKQPILMVETGGSHASVRSLVWQDQSTLLSGGMDKVVRVWDLQDEPRLARTIRPMSWRGPAGIIYAMALSPKPDTSGQRLLAVAGYGVETRRGDFTIFRVPGLEPTGTGEIVARLLPPQGDDPRQIGHRNSILCLAFDPTGLILASGSIDHTVILWDIVPGQPTVVRPRAVLTGPTRETGHTRDVRALAFSPDGKRLATTGGDGSLRLWDVASGRQLDARLGHPQTPAAINSLAFSPDGRYIVVGTETSSVKKGRIYRFDASSLSRIVPVDLFTSAEQGPVECLAYHPNGRQLAVSIKSDLPDLLDPMKITSDLEIRSMPAGTVTHRRRVHGLVYACAFSPSGDRLAYAGGTAQSIFIQDMSDLARAPADLKGHGSTPFDLGFKADEPQVLGFTRELLGPANPPQDPANPPQDYEGFDFAQRKTRTVPKNQLRGAIKEYNGWTLVGNINQNLLEAVNVDGRRWKVDLEPDQERLWWSSTFVPPGPAHDRATVAIGCESGVVIFDLDTGRRTRVFAGHGSPVVSLVPSPDGRWLASSSIDQSIMIYSLAGCDTRPGLGATFVQQPDGTWMIGAIQPRSFAQAMGLLVGDTVVWARILRTRTPPQDYSSPEQIGVFVSRVDGLAPYLESSYIQVRRTMVVPVPGIFGVNLALYQALTAMPSTKRNNPALTLMLGVDKEWVVWTPQGYYDTSIEGDSRFLGWHTNPPLNSLLPTDFVPIGTFAKTMNRPDLLGQVWITGNLDQALAAVAATAPKPENQAYDEQPPKIAVRSAQEGVKPQPPGKVWQVSIPNPTLTLDLLSLGKRKIRELRLVFDERLLPPRNLGLVAEHHENVRVTLPPNRPVRLEVQARGETDSQRSETIDMVYVPPPQAPAPAPAPVEVKPPSPMPAPAVPAKPRVVLLCIGNEKFQARELKPIRFAERDASSLADFLGKHLLTASGPTPLADLEVERLVLTGKQAESDSIQQSLGKLQEMPRNGRLQKGDLVVVVVDSHVLEWEGSAWIVAADSKGPVPPRPLISGRDLSERLGELADYGCRVVLFLDGVHELAEGPLKSDVKAWVRDLQRNRRVITFVASKEGPSGASVREQHGYFAQGLLSAFQAAGAAAARKNAAAPYSLDLFLKAVRQEVLNLSNRRQEVGCYIPPAVSPASLFARP